MSQVSDYLFTVPVSGRYYGWLVATAVVAAIIAIAASQVSRRTGFAAIRRRARQLSVITAALTLVIGISLAARAGAVPVLSWRLWLLLGGAILLGRLVWWLLALRSLTHDKVDERHRHRQRLYFTPRKKRPAKRRRRRSGR